jgi:hypothetical protein
MTLPAIIIVLEAAVFGLSAFGTVKLTDRAVAKFGTSVESSERMRRMYESRRFWKSYSATMGAFSAFIVLFSVAVWFPDLWAYMAASGFSLMLVPIADLMWDVRVARKSKLWG